MNARANTAHGSGVAAAERLARYVTELRFDDLPSMVIEKAKHCLVDGVACAIFGSRFPWSQAIADFATEASSPGPCILPGALDKGLQPAPAALAWGALAHAFELDSLRKPGTGVHPGATVALPALAVAQARGRSGRELIVAIVAGCEVMFRIGSATLHTPEAVGFHAPGLTGPFGAAAAAGKLLGLTSDQLTHAFGLAGSLAGGLLAFAKAGEGGMVKRLHLGRAAEGGVMAAALASRGYEAPKTILEGKFGLLDAFCERSDPALLTAGLGEIYEIERLCIKPYACHVTAQAPVQLLRGWMDEHRFSGTDIAGLTLTVSEKVMSHHDERAPRDLMLAQYSVPFTVALAAYRDPEDPASFSESALDDDAICNLACRIELRPGRPKGWGAGMSVRLADGREISGGLDVFRGCPETPFSAADLERKFMRLASRAGAQALFDRLMRIEHVPDISSPTDDRPSPTMTRHER